MNWYWSEKGQKNVTTSRRLSQRPQGLSSRISLSSSESSVPLLNFFWSSSELPAILYKLYKHTRIRFLIPKINGLRSSERQTWIHRFRLSTSVFINIAIAKFQFNEQMDIPLTCFCVVVDFSRRLISLKQRSDFHRSQRQLVTKELKSYKLTKFTWVLYTCLQNMCFTWLCCSVQLYN